MTSGKFAVVSVTMSCHAASRKLGNSSDPSIVFGGKITTPNQAANSTRHPTKAPILQNAGRIFETSLS